MDCESMPHIRDSLPPASPHSRMRLRVANFCHSQMLVMLKNKQISCPQNESRFPSDYFVNALQWAVKLVNMLEIARKPEGITYVKISKGQV